MNGSQEKRKEVPAFWWPKETPNLPGVKLTRRFFKNWRARLGEADKTVDYTDSAFNEWDRKTCKEFERKVLGADVILIEMRYGLWLDRARQRQKYHYYGDEGEDLVYIRLNGEWFTTAYFLSTRGSGHRSFSIDFYRLLLERKRPTYVIVHDMTLKHVYPKAVPFDRLEDLEKEYFGYTIGHSWLAMSKPQVLAERMAEQRSPQRTVSTSKRGGSDALD